MSEELRQAVRDALEWNEQCDCPMSFKVSSNLRAALNVPEANCGNIAAPQAEPVAWRTFDGEGGYDYRSFEDNEGYAAEWAKQNPRHVGWVEPLYTHPAPAADLVRDAERWRVSNMVAESAWTHPDHRTEAESVAFNAYREARDKGLDHEAATDAAVAAIDAAMKGATS